MNREQAKGVVKHFEVVKAFAEGKAIQARKHSTDPWRDVGPNGWNSPESPSFKSYYEYRVKPEPRKIQMWYNRNGSCSAVRYSWLDNSPPDACFTEGRTFVEFVEILPEDKS